MDNKYKIAWQSISGTRNEQQDRAFFHVEENCVFAVVCDGIGGMTNGEIASAVTVEKMKTLFFTRSNAEDYPAFFLRSVDILDEAVCSLKNDNGCRLSIGTTVVAAAIEDDKLFWLSVGDSRLYILRGGEIVQATRDHNYYLSLDELKKEKRIDQYVYDSEARKGETLISFIGIGGVQMMDINEKPFQLISGDTILLTSDGLYKALSNSEISRLLCVDDIEKALSSLIDKSIEVSAAFQDNTTCIAIRYC